MFTRILKAAASLRLTLLCLALAVVLVFGGTLAQVHLGLYEVQARYFRSWFVTWSAPGGGMTIPVFPGGWLIGGVLLINLIAGHVTRFQLIRNKIGIWLAHLGLIVLLAGQFATEASQKESLMRIETGQTANYSEDSRSFELAVIDTTPADRDDVTAIEASKLKLGAEIRAPKLPFTLRVKGWLPNSAVSRADGAALGALRSSLGVGSRFAFSPVNSNTRMDAEDNPAAHIEIVGDKGPIGDWVVSSWLTRPSSLATLSEWLGADAAAGTAPQAFAFDGHQYRIELRPTRYYKPYTLTLLEFRHDLYPGTDIPKNFSSRAHLNDPTTGESRDVLIYMNNPLRYRGDTYYQSSFEGDHVTILQVVRNPASVSPYVACVLVSAGLLIQFLMHLFNFARKQASAPVAAGKEQRS